MIRLAIPTLAVLVSAFLLPGCGGGGSGPSGTLTGSVVTAGTLTPLAGVQVLVVETNRSTNTDLQGGFTLSGLASGTYTLRFTKAGYDQRDRPVAVVEGVNPPLDPTRLVPTSASQPPGQNPPRTIEGTVQLSGESDHSGVSVELLEGTTVIDTFPATPSSGIYYFWIWPGSYTVRCSKAGYITQTVPVTVQNVDTVVQLLTIVMQKQ